MRPTIITAVIGLLCVCFLPNKLTQTIKEANIRFDLPNQDWFYAEKLKPDSKRTTYVYKRQPVELDEEEDVIPSISFSVEEIGKEMDKKTYFDALKSKLDYIILEEYSSESGKYDFSEAIAYKASYIDVTHEKHTVYVLNGINGKIGFQMMLDVHTDALKHVEKEFLSILKSVR